MDTRAFIPLELGNIGDPFLVRTFGIEVSTQNVFRRSLRGRNRVLFLLSPDHRVNVEFRHDAADTISAIICTIKTINPACHATVAQNVIEAIIIFTNQLSNDLVLLLSLRYIPL